MKRWHEEQHIARRHQREHLQRAHSGVGAGAACACDRQVGRFRKRDAHDIGRAPCPLCRSRCAADATLPRHLRAELSWQDQLQEFFVGPVLLPPTDRDPVRRHPHRDRQRP